MNFSRNIMITHAIVTAMLSNKIISLLLEHNLASQGDFISR